MTGTVVPEVLAIRAYWMNARPPPLVSVTARRLFPANGRLAMVNMTDRRACASYEGVLDVSPHRRIDYDTGLFVRRGYPS